MTPEMAQALNVGDRVKIISLGFLPNMVGRVVFRTMDGRVNVRYFDSSGAPRVVLFYPDELDFP